MRCYMINTTSYLANIAFIIVNLCFLTSQPLSFGLRIFRNIRLFPVFVCRMIFGESLYTKRCVSTPGSLYVFGEECRFNVDQM